MISCTVAGQISLRITSKVNSIIVIYEVFIHSSRNQDLLKETPATRFYWSEILQVSLPFDSRYFDLVTTISPDPVTPLWA
jgi:hypothetical protein